MSTISSKKIAVIHGGISHERANSILYGKSISRIFKDAGNNVIEIHLHPNGSWTKDGKIENLENALSGVESVWNALVGEDGENAMVEKLCAKCKVKVLGHGSLHTEISGNKKKLKDVLKQHKIKSPYSKTLDINNINSDELKCVYQMVGIPALVKPIVGSGGKDIFYVNNFAEFTHAVENIFQKGKSILVEKPILGKHISCFVFTHNNLLHAHVYSDEKLEREEFLQVRNEALFIQNVLGFHHHVKYDFVLNSKGLYLIETNTHASLVHNEIGDIFRKGEVSLSEYLLQKI